MRVGETIHRLRTGQLFQNRDREEAALVLLVFQNHDRTRPA